MGELFVYIVALAIALALSWGVTVGIIKLITVCFGWAFSFPIASGIWLILILAKWVLGSKKE